MQPPKFASKLPQLIALQQQITPPCNKCLPLLKISTRLITTRRNLRKLTLRRKGILMRSNNENVFPFQMNIDFFCSSVHILKVRYFGLDLGIRWFDTLMLSKWLDACVCVCLCAWQNDLQSGFDADSVTTRFSIQHPTQLLTLDT